MDRGRSVYARLPGAKRLLKSKGLEPGGIYNEFLAKQVAKQCEDYVPYDTGTLAKSPKMDAIIPKGGEYVRWRAYGENGYNYASYQYYLQDWYPNPNYSNQNGLRGSHWDKRMMADRKPIIMKHLKDKMRRELKKQNG